MLTTLHKIVNLKAMEFKGTKGEWTAKANTVTKSNGEKIRQILGAQGACMTSMRNNEIRTNADAKLIAAAPELLEALQGLKKMICMYKLSMDHICYVEQAEQAIEKAVH